jgi:hypothetical protein
MPAYVKMSTADINTNITNELRYTAGRAAVRAHTPPTLHMSPSRCTRRHLGGTSSHLPSLAGGSVASAAGLGWEQRSSKSASQVGMYA